MARKTLQTDVPEDVAAALLAAVTQSVVPAQAAQSVAAVGLPGKSIDPSGDKDASPSYRVDALESLTKRLGARFWRLNPVFDWARWQDGRRMPFTRFYFEAEAFVLVDVFAAQGNAVDKEVARKTEAILAENTARAKNKQQPIGYLPVVRGALVSDDQVEAVLRGECIGLCAQRTSETFR